MTTEEHSRPLPGTITTVAGTTVAGYGGDGGPASIARLHQPHGVLVAPDGSLYIADYNNGCVRRVGPDGLIRTIPGTAARLPGAEGGPIGLALSPEGSLYVAEAGNHRVRTVQPDGTIRTVAGTGVGGFAGDGGPATAAELFGPAGLALGPAGRVVIAEKDAGRVRQIEPDGRIVTVAGFPGADPIRADARRRTAPGRPDNGDGGSATAAWVWAPFGLAVGPDGTLYFSDVIDCRIRRVSPDGTIHTVAGTGERGFGGDGGPATAARLHGPTGLALGPDGSLYVADAHNYRVRRIVPEGSIHTVAGNGGTTYQGRGDGGPATEAEVYQPLAVALGPDGSLYIATGHRIRKVWS